MSFTPTSLGTVTTNSTAITSQSLTTTSAIVSPFVLVAIGMNSNPSPSVTSVTDGVNTYQKVVAIEASNSNRRVEFWACFAASNVVSGASITVQLNATLVAPGGQAALLTIAAMQVNLPSGSYDSVGSVSANGVNTTSFTSTSNTWQFTNELAFTFDVSDETSDLGIADSSWTHLFSTGNVALYYQNLTNTAAVSAAWSSIAAGFTNIIGIIGFASVPLPFSNRRLAYRIRH